MNIITSMHINKCKNYIDTMLSIQQWSGLRKSDIDRWIKNFVDLNDDETLLIYKLLTNIIYFSEKDIVDILEDGVDSCLFNKNVLEQQLENDFQLSRKAINNIVDIEKSKTCFIPLLDKEGPHESSNFMLRLLVKNGIIKSHQSLFLNNLDDAINNHGFDKIVIVDDCVGSGDQLKGYWEKKALVQINGESVLLKDYCASKKIDVHYLVLFGYDNSINIIKKKIDGLNILCIKQLSDKQRVFAENSYAWVDNNELLKATELVKKITDENNIEMYGYMGYDFALIMHETIPDWTLPLFWRETPDWKPLLRRKNSNVSTV